MCDAVRVMRYHQKSLDVLIKLADLDGRSMSSYIEWAVKENVKKAKKQGVI
jgi:hypothetical protein